MLRPVLTYTSYDRLYSRPDILVIAGTSGQGKHELTRRKQRTRAMTDLILNCGIQFAKALVVPVWDEYWIITKTSRAARSKINAAFASSQRSVKDFASFISN